MGIETALNPIPAQLAYPDLLQIQLSIGVGDSCITSNLMLWHTLLHVGSVDYDNNCDDVTDEDEEYDSSSD